MICLLACFIGGNHKRLDELSHRYSPNDSIRINGKNWIFIRYQSNRNCWMYSYENCDGKFITTFSRFHLNAMGDFIQLSFADGVDKIETAHDHAPEICENYVQVRLINKKRVDVELKEKCKWNSGILTYIESLLYYDNNCSITQIKWFVIIIKID